MSLDPMTIFSVASTVFSAVSSYGQASSQKKYAEYNAAVARNNAKISEMQAKDVIERGKLERQKHEQKVRALLGKQTAGLAANGIDLGSGSAANILSDTELFGMMDANTISQDADRKAWSHRVQATNDRAQAQGYEYQADSINPGMAAGVTLIGGLTPVASKWLPAGSAAAGSGFSGGIDLSDPLIGTGVKMSPQSYFDASSYWR